MDINDVMRRVADIGFYQYDDERAHGLEDELYFDILNYIANSHTDINNIIDLATEAIKTKQLNFSRWTA